MFWHLSNAPVLISLLAGEVGLRVWGWGVGGSEKDRI